MGKLPRIANITCSRLQFQPGDRVLVRSFHPLTYDEERRLRRSIIKWAGCEVEALIYCGSEMEITVEKSCLR